MVDIFGFAMLNLTIDGYKVIQVGEPSIHSRLVIGFHGGDGDPSSFIKNTGLGSAIEAKGWVGLFPKSKGQGWDIEVDFDIVNTLLTFIPGINPRCRYLVGTSNGAFFAQELATRISNLAGIASVNGRIRYRNRELYAPLNNVLLIDQTADPVVLYAGSPGKYPSASENLNYWAKQNLYLTIRPANLERLKTYTFCPDPDGKTPYQIVSMSESFNLRGRNVIQYIIENGGHTWPGSKNSEPGTGITAQNLDATKVILDFFADRVAW